MEGKYRAYTEADMYKNQIDFLQDNVLNFYDFFLNRKQIRSPV